MQKVNYFLKQVLIIIGVLLLVLIFADVFYKWKQRKKSDQEKLESLKQDRVKYYEGIQRASVNEKWIYLVSRTLIAIGILLANVIYWKWYNQKFDLGEQLNFNEVYILIYSFLAFIIAGTPTKFVKLIRLTIYNFRKREHLGNLDIELINNEIAKLEEKIKNEKPQLII
jgi:uncharacterized membrane protein